MEAQHEEVPAQLQLPETKALHACYHAAVCDRCDWAIMGVRHKCLNCKDYDLCSTCEKKLRGAPVWPSRHRRLHASRALRDRRAQRRPAGVPRGQPRQRVSLRTRACCLPSRSCSWRSGGRCLTIGRTGSACFRCLCCSTRASGPLPWCPPHRRSCACCCSVHPGARHAAQGLLLHAVQEPHPRRPLRVQQLRGAVPPLRGVPRPGVRCSRARLFVRCRVRRCRPDDSPLSPGRHYNAR